MKRISALAGVGLVAALVLGSGTARAGGAMWDWDRFAYEPGETVTGGTSVWITSPQGRPEDGPYHGYLIPWSYDWRDGSFPHVPDSAIYLADIKLDPYEEGASHTHARIMFRIPDVEPGEYAVFHCNDPCTKVLGDIMATPILVVSSEVEGRLIARVEELESQIADLGYRLDHVVPRWDRRVKAGLEERIDALEERVNKPSSVETEPETEALSYFVGAGALGLAAAGAALRRRRHG